MINVQNITKRFGPRPAIENVSFTVGEGEILAFLGPNGAGKTTTMRILTCFMPSSEGTVHIAGFDGFEEPLEVKRRVGYLPENPPLYEEFTVSEYLTFVGRIKGLSSDHITKRMTTVIDQVGLGEVRSRVIGHLSRGYRQRVGLAQAILHDPPVLILDEPTVGLDPKQIIEIRHLIQSLTDSHTIILSTHILPEATAVCQRVIIIHQGQIVAEDTPDQLAARLRQSQKISLTLRNPGPDGEARLRNFPGVVSLIQAGSSKTFLVECELGQDHLEDLAKFVVNEGMGLLEMRSVSMSLEDVFLQLTQDETLDVSSSPDPSNTSLNSGQSTS